MKPQGYIFFGLLIAYTGFTSVNPVFGPLARELGLSKVQAGLIISLAALMLALFSPFWGRRSEVMGRKPVFVIAWSASASVSRSLRWSRSLGFKPRSPSPFYSRF